MEITFAIVNSLLVDFCCNVVACCRSINYIIRPETKKLDIGKTSTRKFFKLKVSAIGKSKSR